MKKCKEPFDLTAYAETFFKKAGALSKKRTLELASLNDELSNFRLIEEMGGATVEQAFLVRMTDKLLEVCKLPSDQLLLKLSNQAMLMAAYIKQKSGEDITLSEWTDNYYGRNIKQMQKKNADYAGATVIPDPFSNFTLTEKMGNSTVDQGFITRLTDKLARITSFVKLGNLQVKSESVEDTLRDVSVYCMLYAAYLKSQE